MNVKRVSLVVFVALAVAAWWTLTHGGFAFRKPATASSFPRVDFEIQDTQDDQLIRNLKIRLLQDMQWMEAGTGAFDLKMTSFVVVDREGRRRGACELYSQIRLQVVASGVLISGESPRIVIVAPCREQNGELILPRLDFSRIKELVQSQTQWEDGPARFEAHWLDEEWSNDWELSRIEMAAVPPFPSLDLDSYEIQAVRPGASLLSTQ